MVTIDGSPLYSKGEATSELRDARPRENDAAPISAGGDLAKPASSQYSKDDGEISSNLIVVISGGEVRERDYLCELERKRTFPHVKLLFVSSDRRAGGLSPRMMLEALEQRHDRFSDTDQIFFVSDVDHYHSELVSILRERQRINATWIISNPCFEVWLYYAHFTFISDELRALEEMPQSQQSSAMKKLNASLVNGGIDPRKAFEKLPENIDNSIRNFSADGHGIPNLFSTNMHQLGTCLLNAIGADRYNQWRAEKARRIEQFRKGL